MLYSCADWLAVDPALLNGEDDNAMEAFPAAKTLINAASAPCSPSGVDATAFGFHSPYSPRSFGDLQRGSFSVAKSIEEFNAIIDADMSSEYNQEPHTFEAPSGNYALPQLLGSLFFANSSAGSTSVASSDIKYGWTPFDDGEFQFACV
ncbi:hypothetical protein FI667_g4143, partial [Globisporangium splendens]